MRDYQSVPARRAGSTINSKQPGMPTSADLEKQRADLASRELDSRFIESIECGEIDGDVIVVDDAGEIVPGTRAHTTIFDLS